MQEQQPPMHLQEDEMRITIWNDKGRIVLDEAVKAQNATQAELDAMVALIEGGLPAHAASLVVASERE